jgi:glutathione S-transferase
MQLLYSPMSPFARKVRMVAHEAGLTESVELVVVSPWSDESLRAQNPLCQVPTLVTEDGATLYDSSVICDHLDMLGGAGLIPSTGAPRWKALTLQALADGMGAAAVAVVRERLRPEDDRRADHVERQTAALSAGLDALEAEELSLEAFRIGEIAVAAQLDYFDARKVLDWRAGRPRLAAWFEAVSKRDAFIATAPKLA